MGIVILILFLSCLFGFSSEDEDIGLEEIQKNVDYTDDIQDLPRNVVLFLASGMSEDTLSKTRVEILKNMSVTDYDRYRRQPFGYLSKRGKFKTSSVDFKPGNLESGLKNIFYGTADTVSCEKNKNDSRNIFSLAQKTGKSTGLVTNLKILSQVPAALLGHEDCFDESKSNISDSFCLLNKAKVNVVFGRGEDKGPKKNEESPKNNTSSMLCSLTDEETFVKRWEKEGFHRILFNISDMSDKNLTDSNVLGLFPDVLKDDIMTLIEGAVEILKSNDKGFFLVVYLKYPNVMETVTLASQMPLLNDYFISYDTLTILTSEYACGKECLRKSITDIENDKFKNQKTDSNISLPTVNKLEKDGNKDEISKENINPDDSEKTYTNTAEEKVNETMNGQEQETVTTNLNKKSVDYEAVTLANEDKFESTSLPSSNLSDTSLTSNLVDDQKTKNFSELSTRKKRDSKEEESKLSLDVPVFAQGPMSALFEGVKRQNYLWFFLKMFFCASEKFASAETCVDDEAVSKYYESLFANKLMRDNLKKSSAPGIFEKPAITWNYLLLAVAYFINFTSKLYI